MRCQVERGADGPGDGRQQAEAIRERRVPALARRRRRWQREFENFDAPLASTPRLAQLGRHPRNVYAVYRIV